MQKKISLMLRRKNNDTCRRFSGKSLKMYVKIGTILSSIQFSKLCIKLPVKRNIHDWYIGY